MAAPAIGVRPRWAPPVTARIDWSHPITTAIKGAWVCVAGAGAIDLCRHVDIPPTGAPTHLGTAFGPAMYSGTTGNQGAETTCPSGHPLRLSQPVTVMWVGSCFGSPDGSNIAPFYGMIYGPTSGDAPWGAFDLARNAGNLIIETNNGGGTHVTVTGASITLGHHVFFGTVTATATELWQDGVRTASAGGNSFTLHATSPRFQFGYQYSDAPRSCDVAHVFGALWNRALSDGEIGALSADPFLFVRR